ncbi:aspartate aminotransferase family protein, partial [Klebsiella pneumoniae]
GRRRGGAARADRPPFRGWGRGGGLFLGVLWFRCLKKTTPLTAADMAAIKGALTEAGLLAFVVENRIHVVPPCTITAEQVAQGLAIFDAVFARFASLAK